MKATTALLWWLPILIAAQTTIPDTEDGTCGKAANLMCTPTWGGCCGADDECGRSDAYCGTGCQADYGNCNVVVAPPATGSTSPDGSCGGTNMYNCTTSTFGDCCSSSGFCGSTAAHCESGCQSAFGTCTTGSGNVTSDGQCGANGKTCVGASYGDCCSSGGWCGLTDAHCDANCQKAFGICPSVTSAVPSATPTSNISTNGQCGANGSGKTCKGSIYGDCCSSGGWCGVTVDHCDAATCQIAFGTCSIASSTSAASPTPTSNVSINGQCGATSGGKTCKGSTFGNCCSTSGWCGVTLDYCLPANCNPAYGICDVVIPISTTTTSTTKTSSTAPSPTSTISTNGSCGGTDKKTCLGSTFGNCCSNAGWCGVTSDFCLAVNCNKAFGTCDAVIPTTSKTMTTTTKTSSATPSPTSSVSTNGSCGGTEKKTCVGSTFGNCCSSSGFCGSDSAFCGAGCQTAFGLGCSAATTISTDGLCSTNKKTCKGSTFGDCCSSANYCGSTTAHCTTGCQLAFGTCSTPGTISTDGSCGTRNGKSCVGSTFGSCCSSTGYCGLTTDHCGQGCQKPSSSACLTANIPSMDGTCGTIVNLTCTGGAFDGQCCSSSGYCGSATTFCGTGCQKNFGKCT